MLPPVLAVPMLFVLFVLPLLLIVPVVDVPMLPAPLVLLLMLPVPVPVPAVPVVVPVPMVPGVLWLLMPGLLVVPPPVGPMVVLVDELLSRGVLLVVPTLPVGLAPPELMVLCADVPVWACTGRQNRAVPAIKAAVVTIREIIASPVCCVAPQTRQRIGMLSGAAAFGPQGGV
jgi:hypothetical protein